MVRRIRRCMVQKRTSETQKQRWWSGVTAWRNIEVCSLSFRLHGISSPMNDSKNPVYSITPGSISIYLREGNKRRTASGWAWANFLRMFKRTASFWPTSNSSRWHWRTIDQSWWTSVASTPYWVFIGFYLISSSPSRLPRSKLTDDITWTPFF